MTVETFIDRMERKYIYNVYSHLAGLILVYFPFLPPIRKLHTKLWKQRLEGYKKLFKEGCVVVSCHDFVNILLFLSGQDLQVCLTCVVSIENNCAKHQLRLTLFIIIWIFLLAYNCFMGVLMLFLSSNDFNRFSSTEFYDKL